MPDTSQGKDCLPRPRTFAASEIYENGKYSFEGKQISFTELNAWYEAMISKYPIISIEDGMAEQDKDGWIYHTKSLGDKLQLVGDDVFVTNPEIFAERYQGWNRKRNSD